MAQPGASRNRAQHWRFVGSFECCCEICDPGPAPDRSIRPVARRTATRGDLAADQVAVADSQSEFAVAFAVDYVVELCVARARLVYVRREWSSALIVAGQALALVPALAVFGVLRILRAGRLIAVIVRLFAIGVAASHEGRAIIRRNAVGFVFGLAGLTCITSAVAFTLVEDVGEHGRVHSFFDALWWSSATMTTVGYGDIAPVTAVGRLVGLITMVVGISTFAVVTAKVAEFMIRVELERKEATP